LLLLGDEGQVVRNVARDPAKDLFERERAVGAVDADAAEGSRWDDIEDTGDVPARRFDQQ
jgi:hypothetical protein